MPKTIRDDDYDDESVQERPPRKPKAAPAKSGGNTALVVLLILGGVFMVVLLVCGGIGAFLLSWATWTTNTNLVQQTSQVDLQQAEQKWKQMDAAAAAAGNEQERGKAFLEYWLAELCASSLDDAYRRTMKAFQARMSRADFESWVQNNPDIKQISPAWSYGLNVKGPKYTFLLGGHTPPYHLVATREGGEWKVDEVYTLPRR